MELGRFFDYMSIREDRKVKLMAYKFKGGASAWWEKLQFSWARQGKGPVTSWLKMKQLLKAWFLPLDFEQRLFQQYQECWQGGRTIQAYVDDFYCLFAWNDLMKTEDQQVARFNGGLRVAIHDKVSMHPVFTLNEAVSLTTRAQKQLERPRAPINLGAKPKMTQDELTICLIKFRFVDIIFTCKTTYLISNSS